MSDTTLILLLTACTPAPEPPSVVDGVMYVSGAWNLVHAIDPVGTMGQQRDKNVAAVIIDSGHRGPPAILTIDKHSWLPAARAEWSVK